MRKLTTIVLGLLCLQGFALIPTEPACQVTCVEENISISGCLSTDITCLCSSSAYITAGDQCIRSLCSPSDQALARQYAIYVCSLVGITLTTASVSQSTVTFAVVATANANTPSVETTSVTAGGQVVVSTIQVGSTVAGQTQSVLIVPANTNSPSSGSPNSSPSNSSSGTNIGAIVGGVVGGIVGLAILIGILFYVYHRGHRHGRNDVVVRHDPPDEDTTDLEKDAVVPVVVRRKEEAIGGRVRDAEGTDEQRVRDEEIGDHWGGRVRYNEDVEPEDVPSGRLNYPDLDLIGARTRD